MKCSVYFILLCHLLFCINESLDAKFHSRRAKPTVAIIYSNNTYYYNSATNTTLPCRWLKGYRRQNKMCRNRKGLPEVLLQAKDITLSTCTKLFKYDRWNCNYKKSIFKKLYRETAFMQALATAGLIFSVARACSEGKLKSCTCAATYNTNNPTKKSNWAWGGCGDNIATASKIIRNFLQLRLDGDEFKQILNHDGEVGIEIVAKNEEKQCICHGVSGSCVMKTCWKRMKPFKDISRDLKDKYHNAVKWTTHNKANVQILKKSPAETLFFLAQSPNFCSKTRNRQCSDVSNCETLCCGRGHYETTVRVTKECNCRWQDNRLDIECDICTEDEKILICK